MSRHKQDSSAEKLFSELNARALEQAIKMELLEFSAETLTAPQIMVFESLDSTNNEAKRLLKQAYQDEKIMSPHLILAKRQTAGRGRDGKSFFSPAKSGLYFTYVFPWASSLQPVHLTIMTAVAIKRALLKTLQIDVKFKFVNDLILQRRKVGGILVEGRTFCDMTPSQYCILGCGLNLWPPINGWPAELPIAGSLLKSPDEFPVDLDLNRLMSTCFNSLLEALTQLYRGDTDHLAAYAADLLTLENREHPPYGDTVIGKEYTEGELRLQTRTTNFLITKDRISKSLTEHIE